MLFLIAYQDGYFIYMIKYIIPSANIQILSQIFIDSLLAVQLMLI